MVDYCKCVTNCHVFSYGVGLFVRVVVFPECHQFSFYGIHPSLQYSSNLLIKFSFFLTMFKAVSSESLLSVYVYLYLSW